YEPTPDDMLVPVDEISLEVGAFGNEWWAEHLYCTMDVSDLPSDGGAVGMRVDLPFDDGGVAHMRITEAEHGLMSPLFDEPDPDRIEWEAVGWIEGYTCDVERKIDFVSDNGWVAMGVHLAQVPDAVERADERAYRESPLWASFRSWEVEHWNSWRAAVRSAVERFLNSSENNSDVAGNSDDVNGPGRDLLEER
ncbi:MAG: hypothetical protein IJH04_11360, partial [Eggerthellaceae bacterium]|nr:hypothetical protein [Eggerthellaceae bacterium]